MSAAPQFIEPTSGNSIENVLSSFRRNEGYAQPNRYEVSISPPVGGRSWPESKLISRVRGDAQEISLRCETVTLPGRGLASTPDTNVHGPLREIVNNVNYVDSVAMTFHASADLRERVFFEKWQYTAFNPKTWNVGYYNDYIGTVDIYLLSKAGDPKSEPLLGWTSRGKDQRKYGLRLHECFPKEIGPTELSYASNNEIIKLSITMNFRYWTSLDTTQEIKSLPKTRAHAKDIAEDAVDRGYAVHQKLWPSNIPARIVRERLVDAADGGRRPRGVSGWRSSPF